MKRFIYISLVIMAGAIMVNGTLPSKAPQVPLGDGSKLRTIKHDAFKRGEVLKYRVHYGFIDAGEAIVEVKDENKLIGGRPTYHVVANGYSKGSFDWFFKVRDKYESYIDEETMAPWVFIRRCDEGGYKINQNYVFNQHKKTVDADGKNFDTPEYVQDLISSFYYARTLDFSTAKKGDIFTITSFVDNEIFELKIKYMGKETIKTNLGKFKCIKFRPVVQKGRIFKSEEDLNVWVSDDKNKLPIRAEAKILVGSIKLDLIGYMNLASPISIVTN